MPFLNDWKFGYHTYVPYTLNGILGPLRKQSVCVHWVPVHGNHMKITKQPFDAGLPVVGYMPKESCNIPVYCWIGHTNYSLTWPFFCQVLSHVSSSASSLGIGWLDHTTPAPGSLGESIQFSGMEQPCSLV